jgi:hypothetical protein
MAVFSTLRLYPDIIVQALSDHHTPATSNSIQSAKVCLCS